MIPTINPFAESTEVTGLVLRPADPRPNLIEALLSFCSGNRDSPVFEAFCTHYLKLPSTRQPSLNEAVFPRVGAHLVGYGKGYDLVVVGQSRVRRFVILAETFLFRVPDKALHLEKSCSAVYFEPAALESQRKPAQHSLLGGFISDPAQPSGLFGDLAVCVRVIVQVGIACHLGIARQPPLTRRERGQPRAISLNP